MKQAQLGLQLIKLRDGEDAYREAIEPCWKGLNLKVGYNTLHNISRKDTGSDRGFGINSTYAEIGLFLD